MGTVLIIGCGDVGRRVGKQLAARGARVVGVTRSEHSAQTPAGHGIEGLALDLDDPGAVARLPLKDALVFHFAPPPEQGDTDPRVRRVLEAAHAHPPAHVVYISTSGVYGDCHGAWVREDAPANPCTPRARRRWDAEQQWQAYCRDTGVPVVILRVGGIYGPGRLPVERIRKGLTVICPDEAPWSNRIHADDLARACIAAAERGVAGAVYNAADGHPTTMTDYFYRVADAVGMLRPPCVPLSQAKDKLGPAMLSFIEESRRLDTTRLREELGVELRYPSLAKGLPASLAERD